MVGNPDPTEGYPTYDQPVLAAADATVVEVEGRFRDHIPNKALPVTLAEASGNDIVLRLGEGRFAEHAHLKPGSISVRAGQRVREGQVMGLTGNSGSSSGPHLHFRLMSRPSATDADGLPYVLRSFVLQGRVPPLSDSLFASASRGEPLPVAGGPPGRTATSCRWVGTS